MIRPFLRILRLSTVKTYCFAEKISIFKKKNLNLVETAILQLDLNRTAEKYRNKDLSLEEILNFDLYYEDFHSNLPRKSSSKKHLPEFSLANEISSILAQKTMDNYEKILFFLTNREKNLKEIEVLFFLRKIKELNKIDEFKLLNNDLFKKIIELMIGFSFASAEKILHFIKICEDFSINDAELSRKFVVSLEQIAKIYDKKLINKESFMDLVEGFLLIIQKKFDSSEAKEKILSILKLIIRNLEVFSYEEALSFFDNLHKSAVLINPNHLDKLDELFFEFKDKLTIFEAINIVYIFTKNNYKTGSFLQYFNSYFQKIDERNFIETVNTFEFSKLIWSISQQDQSIIETTIYTKLEEILTLFIREKPFPSKDLAIILQAFNHANQGSKVFWSSFSSEKIKELKLGFQELFVIVNNQQKLNVFERKVLCEFFEYFDTKEKFTFYEEISNSQALVFYKVTVTGFHFLLKNFLNGNQKAFELFDVVNDFTEKILERFFSRNKDYKELSIPEVISLYKLMNLTSNLFTINGFEENTDLLDALELLSKRILRKFEDLEIEQIAKLMIFLDFVINSDEDISLKFSVRLEERFSQFAMKVADIQLIYLVPIFWKYGFFNEKIWSILQIKFIQNLEFLEIDAILLPSLIFRQLEKKNVLKENRAFWEMIYGYFEDNGLLNNSKFGEFLKENDVLQERIKEKEKKIEDSNVNIEDYFEKAEKSYNLTIKEVLSGEKIDINLTENLNDLIK